MRTIAAANLRAEPRAARLRRTSHAPAVLALFLVLAVVYTHPLLQRSSSHIANDPYDPILNASILWWNATTLPYSTEWWNPPHYYPSEGVTTFTEHLLGVSVLASPAYWLTGNPLFAHNLALFLTWPLSAWTAYLLAFGLTRRHDAAILAGIAYGFSPYRTAELSHIQSLSSYWLPLVLLGLHRFVDTRRGRWLVLFGVAWLLQSLANGYYILFGAVLIGLWLAYFCSHRDTWRAVPAILAAWVLASVPLVPILWTYHTVHAFYGLRRVMNEVIWFSAEPHSWFEATRFVSLWSLLLTDGRDNLFPGATVLFLILLGTWVALRRARTPRQDPSPVRRRIRLALSTVTLLAFVAMVATAFRGPWRFETAGIVVRMSELDRALAVIFWCGLPLLWLTRSIRDAVGRRSPFLFYAVAAVIVGVLCFGPVLKTGDAIVLEPMPYRWLMYLPGFDQLRVPTRFWMLGVLCLSAATALAFVKVSPSRGRSRVAVFSVVAVAVLADGWIRGINMAVPPEQWPRVERRDSNVPVLELPLGADWDAAATYRSMRHRRRVLNGVSGYDPPHYAPLSSGLASREPDVLRAIASLGPFDIVVNGAQDADGGWAAYATSLDGVIRAATDGARTVYRVPQMEWPEIVLGGVLPIESVRAHAEGVEVVLDGRVTTEWQAGPQEPGQWVIADLGSPREVGGVVHKLGEFARDFPRRLAIDLSLDGAVWQTVWEGPTVGMAFLEAARAPTDAVLRFSFAPREVRFVRLRQLARHENLWRIAELEIRGPYR